MTNLWLIYDTLGLPMTYIWLIYDLFMTYLWLIEKKISLAKFFGNFFGQNWSCKNAKYD